MLDIAFIRQNPDVVRAAVANKRLTLDVSALLDADRVRREHVARLDERRARKNVLSAAIPKALAQERPKLIEEAKLVRAEIERLEPELLEANKTFDDLMLRVPSIPRPEVPLGKGEEDNVEVRKVGTPRAFDFAARDHLDLMTSLGLVNWEGPRKFAGQRLYALVREGAILELAVTRLAVDLLAERGLAVVIPPVMAKERAMTGTGFFPLGREEAYAITADELFLVGTSEVALVSLHADETLEEEALPIAMPVSRRASGERPVPTARTRAACTACTSSRRSSRSSSACPTRSWPRRSTTPCSAMPRPSCRSSRSRTASQSPVPAR